MLWYEVLLGFNSNFAYIFYDTRISRIDIKILIKHVHKFYTRYLITGCQKWLKVVFTWKNLLLDFQLPKAKNIAGSNWFSTLTALVPQFSLLRYFEEHCEANFTYILHAALKFLKAAFPLLDLYSIFRAYTRIT